MIAEWVQALAAVGALGFGWRIARTLGRIDAELVALRWRLEVLERRHGHETGGGPLTPPHRFGKREES